MQQTTCSLSSATPPPRALTLQSLLSIPSAVNRGWQAPLLLSPGNAHRTALSRQEIAEILGAALAIIDGCPDIPEYQDPPEATN
jgi:hypothetical protein